MASDPSPAPRAGGASVTQSNVLPGKVMQPSRVPTVIEMGADNPSPQPVGGPGGGIEATAFLTRTGEGLSISSLLGGSHPVLPAPPPSISRTFRTSNMLEGSLIRRVQPVYPYAAKMAHVEGRVVLSALISKAGTIENLHALSGHPMLVPAAIGAVSQWRYRPYILNNEPIEVETQITVNFTLAGN
jgi:periplasmic protein TonB